MIHNFVTNSESDDLIANAQDRIMRSSVAANKKDMLDKIDERRLSEQAWVTEEMSLAAKRITLRLDAFLDVEATSTIHSESYQGI